MVNPFRRLIKLIRRVMHSRKRKSEMEATGSVSSLDTDNPDNSGDGCPLPAKCNRYDFCAEQELCLAASGVSDHAHFYTAQVGPVVCDSGGVTVSIDKYSTVATLDNLNVKLPCPYGDSYLNNLLPVTRNNSVDTGVPSVNRVLQKLEVHGYHAQQHLNSGTFGNVGSVVLTYSETDAKHIVIKFPAFVENAERRSWSFVGQISYEAAHTKQNEVLIHNKLHHPNIVELLSYQHIDGHTLLHLEYCHHGNLLQLLASHIGNLIPEGAVRSYFHDLIAGLQYLHNQCIVHLDLRPENLLITRGNQIKICDFSEAAVYQSQDPLFTSKIGVTGYKAPETMCKNPTYDPRYVDIWVTGCILYRMTTGTVPFLRIPLDIASTPRTSAIELMKKGTKRSLSLGEAYVTPSLQRLLEKILQFRPESRCTLNAIQLDEWMKAGTAVQISGLYMTGPMKRRPVTS